MSIGFLTRIKTLHLGNNNLTRELPSSLESCTQLMVLDVGGNKLLGKIPTWIGKSLRNLVILSLRSNYFYGSVPSELCRLVDLRLLDLSSNDLYNKIPNCLDNFVAMKQIGSNNTAIGRTSVNLFYYFGLELGSNYYISKLFLIWKGAEYQFKNPELPKSIDMSRNNLLGDIQTEIIKLVGLVSLNLSRNNLSGQIWQEIGQLKSLDALDLLNNRLSGEIPLSLSKVDRLNTLELSSNNLSGKIPTGTQLQTLDANAYVGNIDLCGPPLLKECLDE